jgi:hypothetical protein
MVRSDHHRRIASDFRKSRRWRDGEALLQQNFSGKRMLVVDDEPGHSEIARMLLDDAGILMDMQMPNLNGRHATRRGESARFPATCKPRSSP